MKFCKVDCHSLDKSEHAHMSLISYKDNVRVIFICKIAILFQELPQQQCFSFLRTGKIAQLKGQICLKISIFTFRICEINSNSRHVIKLSLIFMKLNELLLDVVLKRKLTAF